MIAERDEFGGGKRCAGGLEFGRRHAGGKLHAKVHHRALRRGEEIADALEPEHVGDLVRIADRGGDAVGKDAAIELKRRHQRRFDVEVRVDEAGHAGEATPVDLALTLVARMRADDAIADDGDVGAGHLAGDDVEEIDVADHEIGGLATGACRDGAGEKSAIRLPRGSHPLRYQGTATTGNRQPATWPR